MNPVCVGRVVFSGEGCFLEHRNSSNHHQRTALVLALPGRGPASSAETAQYLREEVRATNDSWLILGGEWEGEGADLRFLMTSARMPPLHEGYASYSGGKVYLLKSSGRRLLKRLGSTAIATQMVQSRGIQQGNALSVRGVEGVAAGNVVVIEIEDIL